MDSSTTRRKTGRTSSTSSSRGGKSKGPVMEDSSFKYNAKDFIQSRQCVALESCYTLGRVLGEGAHGCVYACTHLETGSERAVKVMEKCPERAEKNKATIEEYQILKDLDHPNLIRCYELLEDEVNYYIVTDLCESGDLLDVIQRRDTGTLPEQDVASVINALLACTNYYHQRNIIHRDLKLENILLHDHDFNDVKVIDFGLAMTLEEGQRLNEIVGTPYYVAPEMLKRRYGTKADIWSVGVIAFMLLGGYAPFDGDNNKEILEAVRKGDFVCDDDAWDDVSDEALEFLLFLLNKNPKKRPTAAEALEHPWLASQRDRCLRRSKTRRRSLRNSLNGLTQFQSRGCLLKQATSAMMASQHQHNDEVKLIGRAFQTFDQSCSGELSKGDFASVMKVVFGENDKNKSAGDKDLSAICIDSLFEQVNVSRSGTIAYSEFVGACLLQKNTGDEDSILQIFRSFDKTDKGCITRKDLCEVLSVPDDSNIDTIIREADTSGKGVISYEDFRTQMVGHPAPPTPTAEPSPTPTAEPTPAAPSSIRVSKDKGNGLKKLGKRLLGAKKQPTKTAAVTGTRYSRQRRISAQGA